MSNLLCSSIGKKLLMSISGLFLIMFLLVHLTLNSFLLIPDGGELFNQAAHFMATNPIIKIVEPVLGLGFLVHIFYGLYLAKQNMAARGSQGYASGNKTGDVQWASKNMVVLGITIAAFLALHLANFWVKMKFTGDAALNEVEINGTLMENAYALVNAAFGQIWIVALYVIGCLGLGFHLSHGFWSAFQTIGLSNQIWRKRLSCVGAIFAWFIALGFSAIAVGQFLFFQA